MEYKIIEEQKGALDLDLEEYWHQQGMEIYY